MSCPIDNEYWKLGCWLQFKRTEKNQPTTAKCEGCNGHGETGGGFKSIDGPEKCWECFGTGTKTTYHEVPPAPAIPEELNKAVGEAIKKFFKGECTEGNNCACWGDPEGVRQTCHNWKKGYKQ